MNRHGMEENKRLAQSYLDGELSPYETVEFENELKRNSRLVSEVERMRQLRDELRYACTPRINESRFEGFAAAVSTGLSNPQSGRFDVSFSKSAYGAKFRIAVGFVAAVLLVVLFSFGYGFKKGIASANSVKINKVEVSEGSGFELISPEGANFSVIRITRKKIGNVVVNEVETADGIDYNVDVDPDSGDATIRLFKGN